MSVDIQITITEHHLNLIKRLRFELDESAYEGAPSAGLKRPYGNSDVIGDIAEVVLPEDHPWFAPDSDGEAPIDLYSMEEWDKDLYDDLIEIHRQVPDALNVIITQQTFDVLGTWKRNFPFNEWKRVA